MSQGDLGGVDRVMDIGLRTDPRVRALCRAGDSKRASVVMLLDTVAPLFNPPTPLTSPAAFIVHFATNRTGSLPISTLTIA